MLVLKFPRKDTKEKEKRKEKRPKLVTGKNEHFHTSEQHVNQNEGCRVVQPHANTHPRPYVLAQNTHAQVKSHPKRTQSVCRKNEVLFTKQEGI